MNNPMLYTDPTGYKWDWNWLNPVHWMSEGMQWINDNTTELRQKMVDIGVPDFNVGYNTSQGSFHSIGDGGPIYHNQLGNDYAGVVDDAISDARGREAFVSGESLAGVANSGTGPGWEAYAGAAASIGKEMYYSKRYGTWMGKNFKMYKQTWGGNGFAGGKNKFGKTTSNSFKWAGRIVGVYSGYRTIEQRVNDEIGTGWMSAELGTTAVSTFGGVLGAAWGIGWEAGRAITTSEVYQEFKFNLWYNHWERQIGSPSQSNEALWYYFYQNYKP